MSLVTRRLVRAAKQSIISPASYVSENMQAFCIFVEFSLTIMPRRSKSISAGERVLGRARLTWAFVTSQGRGFDSAGQVRVDRLLTLMSACCIRELVNLTEG